MVERGTRRRRPGGRRFFPRRKVCTFCLDRVGAIDYKDVSRLRRFTSEWAKIEPRRKNGNCSPGQAALTTAIKRARYLGLLPYTGSHSQIDLSQVDRRGDRGRRDRRPQPPSVTERAPASPPAAPEAAVTTEAPQASVEATPEQSGGSKVEETES